MDGSHHHHARHAKKASSKVYVENAPTVTIAGSVEEPTRPKRSGQRNHEVSSIPELSVTDSCIHPQINGNIATPTPSASSSSSTTIATTAPLVRSTTAAASPPSLLLSTRPKQPPPAARLVSRLSHDISTEQLFSDQLIDGKVADGEDDEEEEEDYADNNNSSNSSKRPPTLSKDGESTIQCPPTKGMYRIESHSALSSLEAKNMDKQQHQDDEKPPKSESPTASSRSSPSKPHKLTPLPMIPSSGATGSTSPSKQTGAMVKDASIGACGKCTSNKEMPPMHCAAYSGHAECLEALLLEDASQQLVDATSTTGVSDVVTQQHQHLQQKRQELDKKHRTPLFYACAANRMDCVSLLLLHRVHWHDLPDKQLDTPVHVCCFFGWHECLAKLLDAGANPHVRNAKGFKPSHIAKTRDCLELLLTFGDDLLQGDKLGRTPLFVASARDRAPCVEFLCAWNHQSRSWMLEQEDQRGDRPIHAAACNGSVEALEILLKYGADPLIPNGKALTPKDLASANNHLKCVEILTRAEEELARATTWYAPANAIAADGGDDEGLSSAEGTGYGGEEGNNNSASDLNDAQSGSPSLASGKGWIECWDYDSSQPFYYHNLTGKCQWEVPQGFTPQLQQRQGGGGGIASPLQVDNQQHQMDTTTGEAEDDGSEYVWVKKKKQTVCVVTGKATEWTAVQDPVSKAIYYKNTRTGQSQWEEPDAVQQLQSASGAHAAQEATRIWDELESSRNALAAAIAKEKHRQLAAHRQTLEGYKRHIRERKEEMRKREEQARLQQLLPRSSFVCRKKQSMMMKASQPPSNNGSGSGSKSTTSSVYAASNDDKLEQICAKEPALDIFLSTYLKLQGVRDLQVMMTTEKRFCNCLYHYYLALVDPMLATSTSGGLSKSQFRSFLRDAAIIPGASAGSTGGGGSSGAVMTAQLKLHIVDLIFAQAARAEAIEASSAISFPPSPSNQPHSPTSLLHHYHRQAAATAMSPAIAGIDNHLTLVGFTTAMQIVRDRVVTQFESQQQQVEQQEIDDDEEWFLMTYLLPLTLKLGAKLLTQIRESKELDLQIAASSALQEFLGQHRQLIQQLHRHYSSQEPKFKMLSFRSLSQFTLDFGLLLSGNLPALHQLYEAVNWISGNAHTEIISFEKFQQLLTMLACLQLTPSASTNGGIGGGGGGGGVAWRAVPSFSPPNSNELSSSGGTGGENHILESLIKFFQQLERSPAKHRIKTELAMSASKISTLSASPPKLLTGQSSRGINSEEFGSTTAATVQLPSSGMFRAPSTPAMQFRS